MLCYVIKILQLPLCALIAKYLDFFLGKHYLFSVFDEWDWSKARKIFEKRFVSMCGLFYIEEI